MKLKERRTSLFVALDKYIKDEGFLVSHYSIEAIKNPKDQAAMRTAQDEIMKDTLRKEMRNHFTNLIWTRFPSNANDIELP